MSFKILFSVYSDLYLIKSLSALTFYLTISIFFKLKFKLKSLILMNN